MSLLFILAGYLFGSLPSGYLLVRWKEKKDIRSLGSRSTGATNVLRAAGWAAALPVLAVDAAKGFLPVVLGARWFPEQPLVPLAASLAAIAGHCYPVMLRFRGGKGVASSLGAFAGMGVGPGLLCLAVFASVIALTRYVSLGSLLAVSSFPLFRLALGARDGPWTWAWWGAILAVVVLRHKDNLGRLLRGEERKLGRTDRERRS